MILIAFCFIFWFRLIWFAILAMHFIGLTVGILMSSSITISLYCREIALRLMLLIIQISLSVLGVPSCLHAK